MTIFLLLSLVLVLSTESMAAPGGGSSQTVLYDELLLVLQWPTSYCNTGMNRCNYPIPLVFTVHGLWLNKNSYGVDCGTPNSRRNLYRYRQVFSLSLLRLATKIKAWKTPLYYSEKPYFFFWSDMKHQRSHTFQSLFSFFSFPLSPPIVSQSHLHTATTKSGLFLFFFFFFFCVFGSFGLVRNCLIPCVWAYLGVLH